MKKIKINRVGVNVKRETRRDYSFNAQARRRFPSSYRRDEQTQLGCDDNESNRIRNSKFEKNSRRAVFEKCTYLREARGVFESSSRYYYLTRADRQ